MTRFLHKSLVFLFPLLILLMVMELGLRQIPNNYSYKKLQMATRADSIETLILGNSQSLYGLNPKLIDGCAFNLAHNAQSIKYDALLLETYLDSLPNLKTVVWPISFFSLYYDLDKSKESRRKKNYQIYYELAQRDQTWKYALELMNDKPSRQLQALKRYYLHHKDHVRCDQYGFAFHKGYSLQPNLAQDARKTSLAHEGLIVLQHLDSNLSHLNAMAELAATREIQIQLMLLPINHHYQPYVSKNLIDDTDAYCRSLASSHANLSYYNFFGWNSEKDDEYADVMHLNLKGANRFSKIINQVLSQ